jgi:hypothetical protein
MKTLLGSCRAGVLLPLLVAAALAAARHGCSVGEGQGGERSLVPPTNVQARPLSPFHAGIGWEERPCPGATCRVERLGPGADWRIVSLPPPGTGYIFDLGLAPDTSYRYRVGACRNGEGCLYSEDVSVETGPGDLPRPSVYVSDPIRIQPGLTLLSIEDPDNILDFSALVAVDEEGNYVWMIGGERFLVISDFELLRGGNLLAMVGSGIEEVTPGGERLWRYDGKLFHHDIDPTPWGTVVGVIGYPEMGPGGKPYSADAILEYDDNLKQETALWPLKQVIPLEEFCPPCLYGADYFFGRDWTHTNAVVLDPDLEHIYLSVRNLNRIYKVSLLTGTVTWIMGDGGDFGRGLFSHQHDPRLLGPDRILLFDNGLHREGAGNFSRVVEIGFDEETRKAALLWEYREKPDFYSEVGGGVQRLENGNTLVTDSVNGRIVEVSPQKEILWQLKLPFPLVIFKAMRAAQFPLVEE